MQGLRALAMVGFFVSVPALAELTSTNPAEACVWLESHLLPTGDWSDRWEGEYGCSSTYRDVGAAPAIGLANNLAYYVQGDAKTVSQVKLVLNVNFQGSATAAKHELLNASQALAQKALGERLPDSVVQAVMEGLYWSQQVGSGRVKVLKDEWPSGRGYSITINFE